MIRQENKYSIQCLHCLEEVTSLWRHDFCSCFCGRVFIDGGDAYIRTGLEPGTNYLEFRATWTYNKRTGKRHRYSKRLALREGRTA